MRRVRRKSSRRACGSVVDAKGGGGLSGELVPQHTQTVKQPLIDMNSQRNACVSTLICFKRASGEGILDKKRCVTRNMKHKVAQHTHSPEKSDLCCCMSVFSALRLRPIARV